MPVDDVEKPIAIEVAEIAGVKPAASESLGGLPRPPIVAGHDARAPHEDLSNLARWDGSTHALDSDLGGKERSAGRTQLCQRIGRRDRGNLRGGLRQSVRLDDRRAQPRACLQQRQRRRAATQKEAAKRRRVAPALALLQHPLQHHTHERDDRHAVLVDRPIDDRRIEALLQYSRNSVDHAAEEDREATDVKQRQDGQPAVVRAQPEVEQRSDRAPPVIAPGKHYALRSVGGPGRVDDCVRRGQVDGWVSRTHRLAVARLGPFDRIGCEQLQLRQAAAQLFGGDGVRRIVDEQVRLCIRQLPDMLVRRKAGIERQQDAAGAWNRVNECHERGATVEQQGDPLASLETGLAEDPSRSRCTLVELAEAPRRSARDQRRCIGGVGRAPGEPVRHRRPDRIGERRQPSRRHALTSFQPLP